MDYRVLVAEDDTKIGRLLLDYLHAEGYRSQWLKDGSEVLPACRQDPPDLLLLDLMLPGMDGLEICRGIRAFSQMPIIMLTARVEEIDRLLGLELGADDYICKPFSPREVMARIKAVLRRFQIPHSANVGSFGPFSMDEASRVIKIGENILALTPNEYNLLRYLLKNPGRVFSRDQLMNAIYEDDRAVSDRTVDSHIKNLRKKISLNLSGQEVIHSIYSVGYKLEF